MLEWHKRILHVRQIIMFVKYIFISHVWITMDPLYDDDVDREELDPDEDAAFYQEIRDYEEDDFDVYNEYELPNPISNDNGLDSSLHLDLTELVDRHGYDSEQGSSRIPPRLLRMLVHPKESLVYLALCGVSIVGYQPRIIDETLSCLDEYLNRCMKKEYIDEASYISQIIAKIKQECKDLQEFEKQPSTTQISHDLQFAMEKQARRESEWKQVETQLDAERDIAISECEIRKQEKLEALKAEWNSDRKRRQFNKPSSYLSDLRSQAKKNLRAYRFKEAMELQAVIAAREDEERRASEERMTEAYKKACERIEKEFQRDLQGVQFTFEKRKLNVDRQKEMAMQPYRQRVSKIEKKKVKIEERSAIMSRCATSSKNRGFITSQEIQPLKTRSPGKIGCFNARLSLPMLKPVKRPPLRASSNTTVVTRPVTNTKRLQESLNTRNKCL